MNRLILLLSLLVVSTVLQAGTVYKCKSADGKMRYQKTACAENTQEVASWTPKTAVTPDEPKQKKKISPIVIPKGEMGHYFLKGDVNSHTIMFVVDTGATMLALPKAVASGANLFCNDKVLMDTAGGRSNGCTTKVTELRLGDFVFKNVDAVIMPVLAQPLLGMNVLQHFDIEQKSGEMRLSEHEEKQ